MQELVPPAPRTRGDGPFPVGIGIGRFKRSPAHTGDGPMYAEVRQNLWRLPCTRGDGPIVDALYTAAQANSPHARGCTLEAVGLRDTRHWIPRMRGDGPCTMQGAAVGDMTPPPRTRVGWTSARRQQASNSADSPADAGMDRTGPRTTVSPGRLPRTRGDGPTNGCGEKTGL